MQDHLDATIRRALCDTYPALDDASPAWESVIRAERAPRRPTGDSIQHERSLIAQRRFQRRRRAAVAATALAAAVAAVLALPRAFPEEHLGASAAAAAVLEQAANAATAYDGAVGGRYAYTKAETLYAAISADPEPFTLLLPSVRETWVAADGSGRVVETRKEPLFLGPRDRERWQAAGGWQPPRTNTDKFVPAQPAVPKDVLVSDAEDLTLEQLDRLLNSVPQLPTDPDRLERIIRAYSEKKDPPLEAQMFNQVSDLVQNPNASGQLRAAAYRVLARIEGVDVEGTQRDSLGRRGVAISAPAGYGGEGELSSTERRRLIIAPDTGVVLAEETILARRVPWVDARPGAVTGSITILAEGWVDSIRERPTDR